MSGTRRSSSELEGAVAALRRARQGRELEDSPTRDANSVGRRGVSVRWQQAPGEQRQGEQANTAAGVGITWTRRVRGRGRGARKQRSAWAGARRLATWTRCAAGTRDDVSRTQGVAEGADDGGVLGDDGRRPLERAVG